MVQDRKHDESGTMKKIFISVITILLLFLIGSMAFLYFRTSDYQARFTVKTTPDVAYYNILRWDTWNRKEAGSRITITGKDPVHTISNELILDDTTLIFKWEFIPMNDSVTTVRARVSDPDRKLFNRLTAPFFNTPFKTSVRSNLLDIRTRLDLMLKKFHYEFTGDARFESSPCVYISFNSTVRGKARSMISNVVELNQFVRQNDLQLNGYPFLIVHDWNEVNESFRFDFCFPIKNTEAIPEHPDIRFKTVEGMDAVKTDFYGNYSITDITWYNLAEEANRLGYRSTQKLIEVYHNDPHSGGNELEWKAEIYLGVEPK